MPDRGIAWVRTVACPTQTISLATGEALALLYSRNARIPSASVLKKAPFRTRARSRKNITLEVLLTPHQVRHPFDGRWTAVVRFGSGQSRLPHGRLAKLD
jgi:hypothetical protein